MTTPVPSSILPPDVAGMAVFAALPDALRAAALRAAFSEQQRRRESASLFAADPDAYWNDIRRQGPVVKVSDYHYLLTRRRDVLAALANPKTFLRWRDGGSWLVNRQTVLGSIPVAPLAHKRFRTLLLPFFSKPALNKIEPQLREQAAAMIDTVAPNGACEAMTDIAVPYPRQAFLTLWGLPLEDRDKFIRWGEISTALEISLSGSVVPLTATSLTPEQKQAERELQTYLRTAITDRRRHPNSPGILSKLLTGDDPIDDNEALTLSIFMAEAATFNLTPTIGNAFLELARNPEVRSHLHENPQQIGAFVNEVMRLRPSLSLRSRWTAKETTVAGVTLPRGALVELCIGAINRDEGSDISVTDGNVVRRPQWGFGAGIHRCLGATLARMEVSLIVDEWLRRIPDFELIADPKRSLTHGAPNWLPTHVPLRWG